MQAWSLEALDVNVDAKPRLAEWVFLRQPAVRSFSLAAGSQTQLARAVLLSLSRREVRWAES